MSDPMQASLDPCLEEVAELKRQLARECEAKNDAEALYQGTLKCLAAATAARLRAEAGAAVMRIVLEHLSVIDADERSRTGNEMSWSLGDAWCDVNAALSTDTGARLAAVVSEEMKKPCKYQKADDKRECKQLYGLLAAKPTKLWCVRCRLVDAMGGQP